MSVFRYIWSLVLCRYLGIYGASSYVGIQVYMELDPMSVSRYIWSLVLGRYLGIYGAISYVGI